MAGQADPDPFRRNGDHAEAGTEALEISPAFTLMEMLGSSGLRSVAASASPRLDEEDMAETADSQGMGEAEERITESGHADLQEVGVSAGKCESSFDFSEEEGVSVQVEESNIAEEVVDRKEPARETALEEMAREERHDLPKIEQALEIHAPALDFPTEVSEESRATTTKLRARKNDASASPRSPKDRQKAAERKHLARCDPTKMRVGSPRLQSRPGSKAEPRRGRVGSIGSALAEIGSPRGPTPSRLEVERGRSRTRWDKGRATPESSAIRSTVIRLEVDRGNSNASSEAASGPRTLRLDTSAERERSRASSADGRGKARARSQGPFPSSEKRAKSYGDIEIIRIEAPAVGRESDETAGPSYSSVVFPDCTLLNIPWMASPGFCRSALDLFPACDLPPEPKPIQPVRCPPIDRDFTIATRTPKGSLGDAPMSRRRTSANRMSTYIPKFVPRPIPAENAWKTGICDCWRDPESCCVTGFAPCITFGRVAESVDDDLRSCLINGIIYCLLCFVGLSCCYSSYYRTKLRMKYNLPGSQTSDFYSHCLCQFCALAQEFREQKAQGSAEFAEAGAYELKPTVGRGRTRNQNADDEGPDVVILNAPPIPKKRLAIGESSASASTSLRINSPPRPKPTIAPSPVIMEKS